MNNLEKACSVAVANQSSIYGAHSKYARITRISETKDYYIFDFYTDHVTYGGGGLLVSKKDFSVDFYCMPSYPANIMEMIYHEAVDVEIPEKYRWRK